MVTREKTAEDVAREHGLEMDGECFRIAYELIGRMGDFLAEDLQFGRVRLELCHGQARCTNPDPRLTGLLMDHAWVEVVVPNADFAICVDTIQVDDAGVLVDGDLLPIKLANVSVRKVVRLKHETYYRVGGIDPSTVQRYSVSDALVNALKFGHYGPWPVDEEVRQ